MSEPEIFIKKFIEDKIECETCFRELPCEELITKNGCVWCTTQKPILKKEKKNG